MNACVLDACTIISLVRCKGLEFALGGPSLYVVSPSTFDECDPEAQAALTKLATSGPVLLLDDDLVPVGRPLEIASAFRLGDGEAESLAVSEVFGFHLATDDRRARRMGQVLLEPGRVTGSLGLLRCAVQRGELDATMAWDLYLKMVSTGSFLPAIAGTYFSR